MATQYKAVKESEQYADRNLRFLKQAIDRRASEGRAAPKPAAAKGGEGSDAS